jgi:CRISPR/Cas system CMR-associated protein Cmr3 (group 5 of RAMP superfamily)
MTILRIHSSMRANSISARAHVESASLGVPVIRLQAFKTAILYTQAAMDDRVYRAKVQTIQIFDLSIVDQSSPQRTHSS